MNKFVKIMAAIHDIASEANVSEMPCVEFKFNSQRDRAYFETHLKSIFDAENMSYMNPPFSLKLEGTKVHGVMVRLWP